MIITVTTLKSGPIGVGELALRIVSELKSVGGDSCGALSEQERWREALLTNKPVLQCPHGAPHMAFDQSGPLLVCQSSILVASGPWVSPRRHRPRVAPFGTAGVIATDRPAARRERLATDALRQDAAEGDGIERHQGRDDERVVGVQGDVKPMQENKAQEDFEVPSALLLEVFKNANTQQMHYIFRLLMGSL